MAVNPDDYPLERTSRNGTGRMVTLHRCVRCTDDPEVAGEPFLVLEPEEHEAKVHSDG